MNRGEQNSVSGHHCTGTMVLQGVTQIVCFLIPPFYWTYVDETGIRLSFYVLNKEGGGFDFLKKKISTFWPENHFTW